MVDYIGGTVYSHSMNLELFAKLLAIPSVSGKEDLMMEFLEEQIRQRGVNRCGNVWTDDHKNVYVVKGKADFYPCLSAHIDTVQPFDRKVRIQQMDDIFVGFTRKGKRAGIGADCKTGIMVCLEALERLDNVALCLFAYEEYGGKGANSADAEFFKHIGYVIEHDCPARHLFSYRNSGVRLFQNDGEFIQRALPILQSRNMLWQDHPYTDVTFLRKRFPLSMMNLSSGYYNWHTDKEYARISDMEHALDMTLELVKALGTERYPFPIHSEQQCKAEPLMEVGPLAVQDRVLTG